MNAMKFTIELGIGLSFLLLGPHVDNSVTYQPVLPCRRETVAFVAELLRQQPGALAPGPGGGHIGRSTAYQYLYEGLFVLARRRPTLRGALIAALAAGYSHVIVDGTVVRIDRLSSRRTGQPPITNVGQIQFSRRSW